MTPQERELLSTFLQQLAHSKADPKDPEAEAMIRKALSTQPDAEYLLVQRALGLELASKTLQAQVEKLQAELDQGNRSSGTSFLGNAGSWGRSPPATNARREPMASQQRYGQRPGGVGAAPSAWGSGMLANLATTAAGVVAGSFLYQGIQQLMGHHNTGSATGDNMGASAAASSDTNDALTDEDVADALDESNDSLALDDGDFGSSDLG